MSGFKTPVEIAKAACGASKAKASWSVGQMMILGIMAGAYIGFGGWLMTIVTHDLAAYMGVGFAKFIGGAVFSVGLILVVIAGAELFTGNCMMPLGVMSGCTPLGGVLRNWFWVYLANFVGSVLVAACVYYTGLWDGPIGVYAYKIAAGKMSLPMSEAFFRGVLCNWLVVLAVWMSMAATDIIGKVWAIFFPIMAFVASGFEHSIANMYFMTLGLFIKSSDAVVQAANLPAVKAGAVNAAGFIHNLVPVTLGNMVGGILFVAIFYYLVFKTKLEELG